MADPNTALRECPFCGERDKLEPVTDGVTHWRVCRHCGCDGPVTQTAEYRDSAWNTRSPVERLTGDVAGEIACRFDGIAYTNSDLVIAQRAACAIVPLYGTGDHGEQDAARAGNLWNDHPAVQGALRALHEARSPAAAMQDAVRLTGEQAWDELVNADDRTSPEEYPDMCLITRDELIEFCDRAALGGDQ